MDIIQTITSYITSRYGSQSEAARAWDVSPQFVSNVLAGRKRPPEWMLIEMGVERVVAYRWRKS